MTFARKSLFTVNSIALAGLLATAGAGAMAQTATTPQGDAGTTATSTQASPHSERMGRYDPARMQEYMAKRQAAMKAKLQITPAQEGAWTAFTAAMQPPADMMGARSGGRIESGAKTRLRSCRNPSGGRFTIGAKSQGQRAQANL